MAVTRRTLIAGAAAGLASSAIAAPSVISLPSTCKTVVSHVRLFAVDAEYREDKLLDLLHHLSGTPVSTSSTLIAPGSPLASMGGDATLWHLGRVEKIADRIVTSADGASTPAVVGKKMKTLVKRTVVTDHFGDSATESVYDDFETGLLVDILPVAARDGTVDLKVAHRVVEIERWDDVDASKSADSIPAVRSSLQVDKIRIPAGRSSLHVRYVTVPDDASRTRKLLVTLITPQVV